MDFATRAIHAGYNPKEHFGSVSVPIYQVSTFEMLEPNKRGRYSYSRTNNPTREALERILSNLSEGKSARACASGMAAIDTALSVLDPKDTILVSDQIYGGTFRILEKILLKRQIRIKYHHFQNLDELESEIDPTVKMIWFETPSNPLLKIFDIKGIARLCKSRGILSVVDNTFLSPYLQRPLDLGIDIEVQSLTKYLGGHSDLIGGAVIVRDAELGEKLALYSTMVGNMLNPFDSWLTIRGIKTLVIRMNAHCSNATQIAQVLREHPSIEQVYFPGFEDHPGHGIHNSQSSGPGGMVSAEFQSENQALSFLSALRFFLIGPSLGGVESLASHPPSSSHRFLSEEERKQRGIQQGLVRLSIGIESVDDLIGDISLALSKVKKNEGTP